MTEQPILRTAEPSSVLHRRLARVRVLRLALPTVAALLVLLLVGQLAWNALSGARKPTVAAAADTTVRMVSPTFTGEGRDGSHYQVTATSGQRDAKDEKRINLQQPVVVVTRNGQVDTQSTSQTGVFQEDQRKLLLNGEVQVKNSSGYNFTAQNAIIDTATGQVAGQAIQGHGLAGNVQSNNYAAYDKGDRVVFKGGVRARLNDNK
jgi:lipopolysaccharide export system protein LptC